MEHSNTSYGLKVTGDCVPNPVTVTINRSEDVESNTVLVYEDKDGKIQALTSWNQDYIKKDNSDPMPYVRYEHHQNEINDETKTLSRIVSGLSRGCPGPLSIKLTRDVKNNKEYTFSLNSTNYDTTTGDSAYQKLENTKK